MYSIKTSHLNDMTYRSLIAVRQLHERLASAVSSSSSGVTASLRVCDATVTGADPKANYLDAHIPGAVFFDLNECADRTSGLTRTVPSPAVFEEYVNHLGIGER